MRIRTAIHVALAAGIALTSCKPKSKPPFPDNFLFGVATAGFQNEMGCDPSAVPESACEDQNSDWYQWITTPEIISDATEAIVGGPPLTGPGWFQSYPQDLALAKNDLHVGAVRISLEWSRIFPSSTVGITGYTNLKAIASPAGITFYHSLLAEIHQLGLTPLVTINHYTLPLWIHNGVACHDDISTCTARGWLDSGTITEIAKYAGFVAQEYGSQVTLWATLNEPLAVPLSGYVQPGAQRSNPPGLLLDVTDAKTVILNEIAAHAQMYDAVKAVDSSAQIGLVYNMAPVYPADPSNELDVQAAKNIFYVYNSVFLNAIINGKLDSNLTGAATATDRPDLARMDYVGLNYYNRINVVGMSTSFFPSFSPLLTFDPTNPETNLGVIYTKGIYEMIQYVDKTYNHIPIYVTENGVDQGAADPTAPHDCVQYVEWMQQAIAEGADVRGYFWWTLTDNYEWNSGMTRSFGLYSVDITQPTKPRAIRPLGSTYAQIAGARAVPASLANQYPIQ